MLFFLYTQFISSLHCPPMFLMCFVSPCTLCFSPLDQWTHTSSASVFISHNNEDNLVNFHSSDQHRLKWANSTVATKCDFPPTLQSLESKLTQLAVIISCTLYNNIVQQLQSAPTGRPREDVQNCCDRGHLPNGGKQHRGERWRD